MPQDLSFYLICKTGKMALIEHRSLDLLSKVRNEADTAMGCQFCLQMSGLHRLKTVTVALALKMLMSLAFHRILL